MNVFRRPALAGRFFVSILARMRFLKIAAGLVIGLYLGALATLYAAQTKLLYLADATPGIDRRLSRIRPLSA